MILVELSGAGRVDVWGRELVSLEQTIKKKVTDCV
jgi:hypothetical protein